jgi:hypothetical protein
MSTTFQEIAYAAEALLAQAGIDDPGQTGDVAAPAVLSRSGIDQPSAALVEWTEQLIGDERAAPAAAFRAAWSECGGDLRKVARRFPEASAAALARRLLLWEIPTVVTVVDAGHVAFRAGNCQHTDRLTPIELRALEDATRARRPAGHREPVRTPPPIDRRCDELRIQAWTLRDDSGLEKTVLRLTVEA